MTTAKILLPRIDDDAPDTDDGATVTRFDVERYACGELVGDAKARLEAAIARDPALKAFYDDVVASDRAFLAEQPPAAFVARLPARASRLGRAASWFSAFRLQAGLGVVAAAAVFVIALRPPASDDDARGPRTKGGPAEPSLSFFVRDGDGGAHVGAAGEHLRAGDQIQLAVTDVDRPAMVVVGVDGSGAVSVYATEQVRVQTEKGGHATRVLPASLVLDDTTGTERFFVVYGDDVEQLERLVRAAAHKLGADVKSGRVDLAEVRRLEVGDLPQSSTHIVKVR